jgi:hypothetical protein
MEVNTVNTASSLVQQQTYAGKPATQSVERSSQSEDTSKAAQAREAQAAQQAQAQQQAQQTRQTEAPKPVVNAQGQKTGTIINTTA